MLFADAQVIQVEWQAMAVFGSAVGGAIVTAAKILATQIGRNSAAQDRRHEENRQDAIAARDDAREARDENRHLSQAILTIQGKTVETLTGLQAEIERVVARLDRLEGVSAGSKTHRPCTEE